jgi:membrane protease YdiL (CAAX protease family)
MNKKAIIHSAIVIMTFLIAFYGKRILSEYFTISISSEYLKIVCYYLWWIVPTVLMTGILFGFKEIFDNIGVNKGFLTGLVFSIICVLPMFISSAIIGRPGADLQILTLIHQTLFAGFMEEYLFRGFLFGLLFRKSGWGFIPASILGALIFGLGHIYQGSTFPETAGVFFVTSLGAVWFAWLYVEWNNNLWVPIFLHILMNLSWGLFEVSSNAFGGFYTNLFRIITITLTIIITIKYNRKNGLKINNEQ